MWKLAVAGICIVVASCATNVPKNEEAVYEQIEVERDTFKNQTWIKTPLYLSRQGFTDTFPVRLRFRALYRGGARSFIQLYVSAMDVDWGFLHSANGEDGYSFEFVEIDGIVDSSGGMVTTEEHFGLMVPLDYLERMTEKDWRIKVYGKRREGIFVVPSELSDAFLTKIDCFEAMICD
jgi:hypothetical protein